MSSLPAKTSRIYTAVYAALLALWITLTFSLTVLDFFLFDNSVTVEALVNMSLCAYLVCELVVLFQPSPDHDSIAHYITTFHLKSPIKSFVVLSSILAWLVELYAKSLVVGYITVFIAATTAAFFDNPRSTNTILAHLQAIAADKVEAFTVYSGIDPLDIFEIVPASIVLVIVALGWFGFGSLTVYLLRLGWKCLGVPLGSPPTPKTVTRA